ncbi:DUF6230 family protein [Streptomyces sp. NPDC048409]|uniref:DUF6230 family protein n=1 Tax=Streptomyces sp. NPDC048409 TaxID=3154723 RepID=UPI0034344E12
MSHRAGRTRWRLFGVVLVPAVAACATVGIGMAQGVLAASFFVSGEKFQVTADSLTARGVSLYSMIDVTRKRELIPVVVTGFRHATISGLCEAITVDVPVLGTQTLLISGGDKRLVGATDLFLDATAEAAAQANFTGLDIGVAQGAISKGPVRSGDRDSRFFDPDGVGLQSTSVTLTDVRVNTVAVSAGTLNIPGLRIRIESGARSCA